MGCLDWFCVRGDCDCGVPAFMSAYIAGFSCAGAVALAAAEAMLAEDSRAGRFDGGESDAFQLLIRVLASAMFAKMSFVGSFNLITIDVGLSIDIIAKRAGLASASAM